MKKLKPLMLTKHYISSERKEKTVARCVGSAGHWRLTFVPEKGKNHNSEKSVRRAHLLFHNTLEIINYNSDAGLGLRSLRSARY